MTTDPTTELDVASDAEAEPGLKERNLQFVLLKAIADAAAEELGRLRANHLTPLLEQYDANGTTSFKVRLPGPAGQDSLIATVSLGVPKDKLEIADEQAFTDWCAANHPEAVHVETIPGEPERTVVIPATEDRVERTLLSKPVNALFKQLKVTENGIVDPSTGMLVDGVANVPGARPNSFAVNYEPDGREQLAGAYRAGKLDHVVAGTTLPEVAAVRTVVERRLEAAPAIVADAGWCAPEGTPGAVGPHPSRIDWSKVPVQRDEVAPRGGLRWGAVPDDVAGELAAESGLPGEIAAEIDYTGSHGRLNGVGVPSAWAAADGPAYDEDDPHTEGGQCGAPECVGCGNTEPVSPARAALEEHADEIAAAQPRRGEFDQARADAVIAAFGVDRDTSGDDDAFDPGTW